MPVIPVENLATFVGDRALANTTDGYKTLGLRLPKVAGCALKMPTAGI
jgi:hypothetical protein